MAGKKDEKTETPERTAELELATLRHKAAGSPGDEKPKEDTPAPTKVPDAMGR